MTGNFPDVLKAPRVKQIDVLCLGLAMSDQLLIAALLQLVPAADGHAFRISDQGDAAVVIFNPADENAAKLAANPQRGIAYIQYGASEITFGRVWRLSVPVRLSALIEVLTAVLKQRREWIFSGALAPEPTVAPVGVVPAHRRLEHVLGVLDSIVQSRIPQAICGVTGVEMMIYPQQNAVYIQCEPSVRTWQKALTDTQRPITVLSRVGARVTTETPPITMAQFRWELARHLSVGMLLPGLAVRQEFALTRWPDFGTLSAGSAYDLRIVALIAARPCSIANMLKTVPYTREGVIALLNGCALVGCLRDAPPDLLRSSEICAVLQTPVDARAVVTAANGERIAANRPQAEPKAQRVFSGMLGKLRAALGFVPRAGS